MFNKIIIGSAQFGLNYGYNNLSTPIKLKEIEKIIELAHNYKINKIDTAISYGNSEKIIGSLKLNNWDIFTKIPSIPNNIKNIETWISNNLEKSLENLKIDKHKGVLFHDTKQLKKITEKINISKIKKKFEFDYFGLSIYDIEDFFCLNSKYNFDVIQVPYNIFDRQIESKIKKIKEMNIIVQARSIFLQGVLLTKFNKLNKYFHKWNSIFYCWENWLQKKGLNHLEGCLSLIKNDNTIDYVVIGIKNSIELKTIISTLKHNLPKPPKYLSSNSKHLINPTNWDINE